ncbi:MATE family efflux transporter [Peptoniphilus mikwangii]|uniref:MATE family efflux transporter n=1 Tax=Peptoniphilus mikwangii TaxID=1354300 RepID=UPI0003F59A89|nr:MATE family efflux transporter [Peptoniphilus mikwangii]
MHNNKQIFNKLVQLSIPTMAAMLLQSIYDIVDMYWVGKISSQAISAVTLFSTILWLFEVLNEIIGVSSVSMISQSVGRNDIEMKEKICEQTLSFKFLMGILTSILLFIFIKPLLHFYTPDKTVIDIALSYGYLRIFFIPIMFSSFSVNSIFRCTGDPKTPMKIMGFCAILNMILDPIFMFEKVPFINITGFNLGTFGAAVATVISTSVSFLIGFFILLKGNNYIKIKFKNLFRLIPNIDYKLITVGIPGAFESFLTFLFEAARVKFVASYGLIPLTAAGISSKIYGVSMLPMMGLLMGGSVLVGNFLGEENIDAAEETSKTAAKFNAIILFVFTLICFIFSKKLISIFTNDIDVINMGAIFLPASAMCISFLGYGLGRATVFMGSGYNTPLLISSLVSQWILQMPLIILCRKLNLPVQYLWYTYIPSDFLFFVMIMVYHKQGKWKNKRV